MDRSLSYNCFVFFQLGVICGCIFFFTEAMLCAPFVPCLMIPTEIVFHVWNIKSVTKDSFNRTKV